MFGRSPRLPVDIAFGLEVEGKKEQSTKYVETMNERLKKHISLHPDQLEQHKDNRNLHTTRKYEEPSCNPATEY